MEQLILDENTVQLENLAINLDFGHIDENGNIIKEYSDEADAMVYRSMEAFEKKEGICYINESDVEYTYNDFLEGASGNAEIAGWCFEMMICTWNYPDSYIDDGIEEGYFTQCTGCGYLFDHNEDAECPICKTMYIEEE